MATSCSLSGASRSDTTVKLGDETSKVLAGPLVISCKSGLGLKMKNDQEKLASLVKSDQLNGHSRPPGVTQAPNPVDLFFLEVGQSRLELGM